VSLILFLSAAFAVLSPDDGEAKAGPESNTAATTPSQEVADAANQKFGVPIVDAIWENDIAHVRRYLAHGGDPNLCLSTDPCHGEALESLLSIASYSERREIVSLLLCYGADPRGMSEEHHFPLWWAARSGDVEILRMLVTRGAPINFRRGNYRGLPLECAISWNHPDAVRFLLERGASTQFLMNDSLGTPSQTPLDYTREYKLTEIEQILLTTRPLTETSAPRRTRLRRLRLFAGRRPTVATPQSLEIVTVPQELPRSFFQPTGSVVY
jgi:hypothetical protein